MIKIFFANESSGMVLVEIEDEQGRSIDVGKWSKEDIYNILTITKEDLEKFKSTEVNRLEEYIGELEHENELLYGRLNSIRELVDKKIK